MKKGEIYEGIIEKVDFPNKGRVQIGDRTVIVKNGMPGQKAPGSTGKITSGNQRTGMQYFSGLRRLYVSDHVL